MLRGDVVGLRTLFLETVHLLRASQVPLEDLSVLVTLHKSPPQYRRGGTHEEPYEVLLAAGIRSWRVGQRIRYFRARGGEPRLLQEGDGLNRRRSGHRVLRPAPLCAVLPAVRPGLPPRRLRKDLSPASRQRALRRAGDAK